MDATVALPVVITTILATLFYVGAASLSLIFRFCPYKSASTLLLSSCWIRIIHHRYAHNLISISIALFTWLPSIPQQLPLLWETRLHGRGLAIHTNSADIEPRQDAATSLEPLSLYQRFKEARQHVERWAKKCSETSHAHTSQLVERETPMDNITSSMLSWMIVHCEDSRSVDLALQALAGAELRLLPRQLLWRCGAVELTSQRLKLCLDSLPSTPSSDFLLEQATMLNEASLYSRSLHFLTTLVQGEGFEITHKLLGRSNGVLFKSDNKALQRLGIEAGDTYYCLLHTHRLLNCSWDGSDNWCAIAAFALDTIPLELDRKSWELLNHERGQSPRQWELLKRIATGRVANLPPSAILALINGITKTYLYNPNQSPAPLVELLDMHSKTPHSELSHALGVALTIAAFANGDYPPVATSTNNELTPDARLARTKEVYHRISMGGAETLCTDSYLSFGLLEMVRKPAQRGGWDLSAAQISSIVLQGTSHSLAGYYSIIPTLPIYFERELQVHHIVSNWLGAASQGAGGALKPGSSESLIIQGLDVLMCPAVCKRFNGDTIALLIQHFTSSEFTELRKLCLRGIRHSIGPSWSLHSVLNRLAQTNFIVQALEFTRLTSTSMDISLHTMGFLWLTTDALIGLASQPAWRRHPAAPAIVRALCNEISGPPQSDELPTNIVDMGFAELWILDLINACREVPQKVLESKILGYMLGSYQGSRNDIKPRIIELSHPFDSGWTWVRVLQHLEETCMLATQQGNSRCMQSTQKSGLQTLDLYMGEQDENQWRSRGDRH